jgi:hypothetical protein
LFVGTSFTPLYTVRLTEQAITICYHALTARLALA